MAKRNIKPTHVIQEQSWCLFGRDEGQKLKKLEPQAISSSSLTGIENKEENLKDLRVVPIEIEDRKRFNKGTQNDLGPIPTERIIIYLFRIVEIQVSWHAKT
ncbi:hypothetical protein Csa_006983 [Cucumis sativus]|uniref:Uncharacterized protein n=1 Tax=Cucumis sativus TaxID=3659 RepID=A0A0A0LZY7_CUCSA|nr:hypothetical protein Csa_006983 [Cucumis sativus]